MVQQITVCMVKAGNSQVMSMKLTVSNPINIKLFTSQLFATYMLMPGFRLFIYKILYSFLVNCNYYMFFYHYLYTGFP